MLKEIFLGRERTLTPKGIIFHAALILISVLFVYMFSYSTSFRYSMFGGDSAVFQVVGKYWLEGVIPYKDLFDHKGALVYVANALGYAIYPRAGVMVPQIICLYLSCLFIWRATGLYWRGNGVKIFFLALTLIYYAAHYQEGNHVTEYSVPFLSAAAYCFLRSLKENIFPPLYGFVYGVGFGACFLIRLSDAVQICCQVFLVAIFLLQARAFKDLWKNILSFCAGIVLIVLPFVIYFAAHGALYDMFFGTFLFNLKYTTLPLQKFPTLSYVLYCGVHFMPLFVLIVVSLRKIFANSQSRLAWSGFFMGIALLVMLVNFRLFRHYCMILLPMAPMIFAVLAEPTPFIKNLFKRILFRFSVVLVGIYILLNFAILSAPFKLYIVAEDVIEIQKQDLNGNIFLLPKLVATKYDLINDEFSTVEDLARLIPDDEKNSIVTWGYYCTTPHWVLETSIKPRERLFFLNETFGKIDPAFREEFFGNLRKDYPLWILYGKSNGETPDAEFEQLLEEKYSLKGQTFIYPQVMKLYRLKEELN